MGGPWYDWVCWVLGMPLVLAGLWFLWRSYRDPGRRLRRCPQCWYDMRGLAGFICPECGRDAVEERNLHRRRRRAGLTWAGLALILGGYLTGTAPTIRRVGETGLVPTTALLLIARPPDNPIEFPNFNVGTSRFPGAGPTRADRWFRELQRRVSMGAVPQWQLSLLYQRDLDRVILCRDRWPAGEPMCIRLGAGWFGAPARPRLLRVTPRLPDAKPIEQQVFFTGAIPGATSWQGIQRHDQPYTLPPLPAGTTRITFDVEVLEFGGTEPTTVFKGTVTKPVHAAATMHEVIKPIESETITAIIRERLRVSLGNSPEPYVHASLDNIAGLQGVTTGILLEFFHGDEHVASAHVRPATWTPMTGAATLYGDIPRVITSLDDPAWRVRVSGHAPSAIRDFQGTAYWVGSFEKNLSDLLYSYTDFSGKP